MAYRENIDEFIHWEKNSRDVIDVKRCYIRAAGDHAAGVMLSQIVYWFLPDKRGLAKTTIEISGYRWIAKRLSDWQEECELSPDQARRCIKRLEQRDLIATCCRKFYGTPTTHIRLVWEGLIFKLGEEVPNRTGVFTTSGAGVMPLANGAFANSLNKEEITDKEHLIDTSGSKTIEHSKKRINHSGLRERDSHLSEAVVLYRATGRGASVNGKTGAAWNFAVDELVSGQNMLAADATVFLLSRVRQYSQSVRRWPIDDRKYVPSLDSWLLSGSHYDADATWDARILKPEETRPCSSSSGANQAVWESVQALVARHGANRRELPGPVSKRDDQGNNLEWGPPIKAPKLDKQTERALEKMSGTVRKGLEMIEQTPASKIRFVRAEFLKAYSLMAEAPASSHELKALEVLQ